MGRINYIWNPKKWKICFEGKSKIIEGDIIYEMVIGEGEDYQPYEITQFISKDNYDKIISGIYFVKTFPYHELPILLFNEQRQLMPLVNGTQVPYEAMDRIQKEFANDYRSRKLLKKLY